MVAKMSDALMREMRGIVEDVLCEGGLLTTDEIYRGVWAKHAQLGLLLPPRWQEKVRQILKVHCISHEGNSWFLKNIEQLEELPECEANLFDPHGTSERIINDSGRSQKRTDCCNTESYRYMDLALPKHVAGDMIRNVVLGIFLSGPRQLRCLANWVYPREEAGRQGHGPERALGSPSSNTRTSSKMPETLEGALLFDERAMRAPSTKAPKPAAREQLPIAPMDSQVTSIRLAERELPDRTKQKLEKLGLLLSDQPKDGAPKLGGPTGSQSVPGTAI